MKRLFKKLLPAVVAIGFLTACEDVPAPYYLLQKIIDSSVILDETFANSLGKFTVYNETDDGYEWANQYNTAYISGYQNQVNKATKSWLISPAFDLSDVDQAYATFEYVLRFKRSTTKERVLVSANYADQISSGVHGTPATATWYDLDIDLPETADYKNFNSVGAQLPPEVLGQKRVHIAFYYEAPANEASTWEVKNLLIKQGEYDDPDKPEPVDAIFYEELINSEGGFTAEPITTPDGSSFKVWNNNNYGWVGTGYDKEKSTNDNRVYYECESWLLSPEIELPEGDSYLTFMHALNYRNNEGLGVYLQVVPDVPSPNGPAWIPLEVNWPAGTSFTFISSGDILLSQYAGQKIQIGFKYTSTSRAAATWELQKFGIYEGTGGGDEPIEGLNGSGTAEDPYDVASALKLISENKIPANDVYVRGVISKIDEINKPDANGRTYGNATYYISDVDESGATIGEALEVYRGKGLGGEDMKTQDYIKIGDDVIVKGILVNYNGKTPEFTQGSIIYSLNGQTAGGGGGGEFGDPTGSGTKADPYNVAATVQLIDQLGSATSDYIYTKGIISQIDEVNKPDANGRTYGNATYYISDDGKTGAQLEVYRGKGLGGVDFAEGDIKVGDDVIVYGKVKLYNGKTREFDQGNYLYMHNGKTVDDQPQAEPRGTGTLEDPFNAAMANLVASRLAKDAISDQAYYIAGKVASVKEQYSTRYGNGSFYISDDGSTTSQFLVFQALYLGNKKYESGTLVKQGDDVIFYGKITNYQGTTPETAKGEAYLYSLNGDTGVEEPQPEGGTYDAPWNVEDVKANFKENSPINSFVKGYVVGYVKGSKFPDSALLWSEALEAAASGSTPPSNLLISTNPQPSSTDECIPIQLPAGDIRSGLNLKDNQAILGVPLLIYGSVDKFFGTAGVKSVSYAEYEMVTPTSQEPEVVVIGTRPDAKKRFTKRLR